MPRRTLTRNTRPRDWPAHGQAQYLDAAARRRALLTAGRGWPAYAVPGAAALDLPSLSDAVGERFVRPDRWTAAP
jgi:hypothetical protein